MKKLIITLSIVVSGLVSQAQQVPLLSNYYYNKFVWNPAMSGFQNYGQAYLIYRNQWNKIPGSPITTAATIDAPLKSKNVGLGASLYSDNAGVFQRTGAMINYAYAINLGANSKLRLGVGLGFVDNRLVLDDISIKHRDDPLLQINNNNKTGFDANFGFNYTYKDFNFGMSIPQVLALDTKYNSNGKGTESPTYKATRHLNFNTFYTFRLAGDKWKIEPNAFVRFTQAEKSPVQYDLSVFANYRELVWGGVMYRSGNAIGLTVGAKLAKQIVVSYAYDIPINNYSTYMRGANEFMLGYHFGASKNYDKEIAELKKTDKRHDTTLISHQNQIDTLKRSITNINNSVTNINIINGNQDKSIDSLRKRPFNVNTPKIDVGGYEFENVLFSTGSYTLSEATKPELDQLVQLMNENKDLKIEISGHTDEVGSTEYNQRLSVKRSQAVVDYMVNKGIDKNRLTIFNYGESKPIDKSNLSANRRVEFRVLEK